MIQFKVYSGSVQIGTITARDKTSGTNKAIRKFKMNNIWLRS